MIYGHIYVTIKACVNINENLKTSFYHKAYVSRGRQLTKKKVIERAKKKKKRF